MSNPAAEEFRRTRCARRAAIGAEPARSRSGIRGRTERAEARSVGRREAERERLAYCWLVEPDLEGGGGFGPEESERWRERGAAASRGNEGGRRNGWRSRARIMPLVSRGEEEEEAEEMSRG